VRAAIKPVPVMNPSLIRDILATDPKEVIGSAGVCREEE